MEYFVLVIKFQFNFHKLAKVELLILILYCESSKKCVRLKHNMNIYCYFSMLQKKFKEQLLLYRATEIF